MSRNLAARRLERATSFLALAREELSAPALHGVAISLELALKAALHRRGWSDDRTRRDIRHCLWTAGIEARGAGLELDERIFPTLRLVGCAYARHDLDRLSDGLSSLDWLHIRGLAHETVARVRRFIA